MAEPIPEDVLATAEEAYQQAIYMTTTDEPQNMVHMVARAILAERERCAHVADTHGLDGGSDFCQGCGEDIAAAIRKGSD